MANTSVGAVAMDLTLDSKLFNKQLNSVTKSTESAFSSTMKKVGGFIAGAFAVTQVVNFTKTCIDSASQVQAAFTGLNSIVEGTGNSFAQAQKFINEYTSDGLVSINEAATAYKNLLARGYDTSQIEDVLTRLKDSAAFGRQASYDLGEAVVTATEGLKNENSILVDNAGVTKNVAKMWDDYAKSIGTTAANLTQEQKIQAEYNGIMEETRFQVGDAAAYTRTFSGQVQQLKFNFTQMTAAIGKVVAPIAQLFIPAINSAMQAVTNLFQSLQNVLKTFGLDMPDVVSKTSSAVNNVSADIENTGASAVSAAKEINKAFAGVDEINVLKTSDSSTTGSNTSAGSSASTAVSVTPASDDAVSTAVSTTVNKIQKYIEPLQNINFDSLVTAFNNLKNAVMPLTSNIFDGLSWAYFNLLVPLAQWTIEDVIPAFLDIFAGAINVVNQAIEDVKPMFSWLWDNILEPIASWTGGVIVSVLNGIGDALQWISGNETAMTILESIAIAIGLVATAIGIYNGVMAICNIVTGTFSGIMAVLTSPITLVVAAIAALIAIITLLINNWDAVSAAASKCWDWIVGVFQGAAEWFNTTIIQPIANFFTGMWDGLKNGASAAWEGIKSVFSTVADFFKSIFTNAWEGVKAVFSTGGKIFDGIKDGIVKAFTTVVNAIIKGINKVVSIPFDGINWALKKIKSIDILGVKPFNWIKTISVPQIPLLAQGGWFDRGSPQLAIVGDNTREPEIVTPESKIYDQVRNAIRDSGGTGKQEIEITIYHKYEDGRTIIQKINQAQIDAGQVLVLS